MEDKNEPNLEPSNVISILISSDFLQMGGLSEECISYISDHLQDIVRLPIDMNCLNSALVKKIASRVHIQDLIDLEDKRDRLLSKIYMKKLEMLFDDESKILFRCQGCGDLYT